MARVQAPPHPVGNDPERPGPGPGSGLGPGLGPSLDAGLGPGLGPGRGLARPRAQQWEPDGAAEERGKAGLLSELEEKRLQSQSSAAKTRDLTTTF